MHVSRNKCELLAEYLLDGVKLQYDIYCIASVKNIKLNMDTANLYRYLQGRLESSGMILKPKYEIYWVWFDSLTECFYILENEIVKIKPGITTPYVFDEVLKRANKNIEKRELEEDIAYV